MPHLCALLAQDFMALRSGYFCSINNAVLDTQKAAAEHVQPVEGVRLLPIFICAYMLMFWVYCIHLQVHCLVDRQTCGASRHF